MDQCVSDAKKRSLSCEEIAKITEGKCEIRFYSELSRCKTLFDAMGPHRACVLLYETKKNYGHWCCFMQISEDVIEFFDSYAIRPDGEAIFISPEGKEEQQVGRLTQMIEHAAQTMRMIYNKVPLQEFSADSDVCGRWCAVRIRKRKLPLEKFQQLFYKQSKTPDELITLMTIVFDSNED